VRKVLLKNLKAKRSYTSKLAADERTVDIELEEQMIVFHEQGTHTLYVPHWAGDFRVEIDKDLDIEEYLR
jgi:hypothetical protein